MSDEAYSLIALLTSIAYAAVLWHQFRRGQALRRLKRLLEEANASKESEKTTGADGDRVP